jgi:ribonuclease R
MRAGATARTVAGRISLHPRGYGFVELDEPGPDGPSSAFVAPPELNTFLAGDRVRAELREDSEGRWSATRLELVERTRRTLFGEVVERRGERYLRPDRAVANSDWRLEPAAALIPGRAALARLEGGRLLVEKVYPEGTDLSLEQVIARYGLRPEHAPEEEREASSLAGRPHALAGARRDLRAVPTITVDAPSTRDIDDAIAVLPADESGALRILVSIADVSEHVTVGSALDAAARERATSVYLAGRVLPMLPDALSADALSLLPGVDRHTLTVELRLDPEGQVTAIDLYESLIRSLGRVSYSELAEYLDGGRGGPALEPVRAALPWLRTADARLELYRMRRGGVQHAQDESRIVFDEESGAPAAVEATRLTSAHRLIERFMVAANEAVARWLHDRGVPALYRVHPEPSPEAVSDLALAARHFGFEPGFARRLTPLSLLAFDRQLSGAPCEAALRSVLLRSLGPARYTTAAESHFGLAAPLYLHFTSPIRRYADLAVHRLIKAYLAGERRFDEPMREELGALAARINERARAAARAERDRLRILVARLMAGRVGEEHAAHVTRVRTFGLLCQLDETMVEGTIPVESLAGGPFRVDARETVLRGAGRSFAIGMPLRVQIVACDPGLGRIELTEAP